jgi:hypothetical protein
MLCTDHDGVHRVYDFLSKYDYLTNLALEKGESETELEITNSLTPRSLKLHASQVTNLNPKTIHNRKSKRFSFSMRMQNRDDIEVDNILEHAQLQLCDKDSSPVEMFDLNSFKVNEKRTTIQRALNIMQEGLIERNEEVKLLLLAALSKEHLLLLGPPGTGRLLFSNYKFIQFYINR